MPDRFVLSRAALAAAALSALLAGCGDAGSPASSIDASSQIGANPVIPEPETPLIASVNVAPVVGWSEGQTPAVPDGLRVTAYAKDLVNPRTVHTLPNGDVIVVQSRAPSGKPVERPKDIVRNWIMAFASGSLFSGAQPESNIVTLLRDTNRDGTVDARHDLLTGMNSPFGIAWYADTLYVATGDAILAYAYQLGQTEISTAPRVLTPLPGGPINHHWTKDLALSPDGRFLYASVGSNSNAAERGIEAEKGRAAIWQVDRETGAARVYASGLRNPNGLNVHPETGVLWTVVNERDEIGPNGSPDYLTSVREGGFYGWPWSYWGNHVDRRVQPARPDLVEKAIVPDYALGSHAASLGLAFAMRSAMPASYQQGAFVGMRGSWNRANFIGYKVVFVPFQNGMPSGKAQDVVTGFLSGGEVRGRPVGVAIDGTGALLIADDAGNTVWRVAAADGTITPNPVGTDPVEVSAAGPGTAGRPSNSAAQGGASGDRADGVAPRPSQTDIAPATLPEAGIAGSPPKQ